ncbi:hypothetical protein A6A06_08790 [Streptomyces sp. CB02923]|nr:hypothetical protein A6A06_08790 [Streptomyces sp. CB02923]
MGCGAGPGHQVADEGMLQSPACAELTRMLRRAALRCTAAFGWLIVADVVGGACRHLLAEHSALPAPTLPADVVPSS